MLFLYDCQEKNKLINANQKLKELSLLNGAKQSSSFFNFLTPN